MHKALSLLLLFFIGSSVGWVLEFFFRRYFAPEKKWVNPGFLTDPCLPIYGFGTCTLYLLASAEVFLPVENITLRRIILFVAMAVCMTVIEYIAGLIFIVGLKTKLWDYSNEKFNLQGIICLKFSLMWAFAGAVYYIFVHPLLSDALIWFDRHRGFYFVLGSVFGIFAVDVVYSFGVVAKIRAFATENHILVRYEELKNTIRKTAEEQKKKYKFLFALRPEVPIREHLNKYLELVRAFDKNEKEKNRKDKKARKNA